MISNSPDSAVSVPPQAAPRRSVTSRELLKDDREISILHAGQEYRLQVTKNGKLILTK